MHVTGYIRVVCFLAAMLAAGGCGPGQLLGPTLTPAPLPSPTPTEAPRREAQAWELRNIVEARADKLVPWDAATEGQQIVVGGGFRTGDEARARVDVTDGTIVRLAPTTEFELLALSPAFADPVTRFQLVAGKLWVAVTQGLGQGSFAIDTPNGSGTVRGSFISVSYAPASGQVIVSCLEGQCRLTGQSGKATNLQTAQQTEIRSVGQDPEPATTIDPAQLADWANEFPEAAALMPQILVVPSTTEGTLFIAEAPGVYRFTITSGAYQNCPPEADPGCGTWSTHVLFYRNRAVAFTPDFKPSDPDFAVGMIDRAATAAEAEAAGMGSQVDVPLAQGDQIILVVYDCPQCYQDNAGSITLAVTRRESAP